MGGSCCSKPTTADNNNGPGDSSGKTSAQRNDIHEVMDLPRFHNIRSVGRNTLCSWDSMTSDVKLTQQQQPDKQEQDLVCSSSSSSSSSEASFYKVGVEIEKPCSARTNGRVGLSILHQFEIG
eukprot:PhF_6_TR4183/c0_g2_i3/m.5626